MLNVQSMNLDLIRTFVIVGQSKDFNEAASQLSIDATNVSRHIKSLENLMGTKLIKKNSKNNIELTEDGKILFEGYEKAYNLLFITEKTFLQSKDLNSCKISIGVSSDVEECLLSNKIIQFKEMYPNVSFKIVNLPVSELYDKLSHYTLDFVIDEKIDVKKSSGIVHQELMEEEFCFVYNKEKYSIEKIEDIQGLPLILPVRTKQERRQLEEYLESLGHRHTLSIETSAYLSSISYAKQGMGIALVPKQKIALEENLGIYDLPFKKEIVISYVEDNVSPSSREFLDLFQK